MKTGPEYCSNNYGNDASFFRHCEENNDAFQSFKPGPGLHIDYYSTEKTRKNGILNTEHWKNYVEPNALMALSKSVAKAVLRSVAVVCAGAWCVVS
jgi:hypothetical protein